jgi:hypothetical protein
MSNNFHWYEVRNFDMSDFSSHDLTSFFDAFPTYDKFFTYFQPFLYEYCKIEFEKNNIDENTLKYVENFGGIVKIQVSKLQTIWIK